MDMVAYVYSKVVRRMLIGEREGDITIIVIAIIVSRLDITTRADHDLDCAIEIEGIVELRNELPLALEEGIQLTL